MFQIFFDIFDPQSPLRHFTLFLLHFDRFNASAANESLTKFVEQRSHAVQGFVASGLQPWIVGDIQWIVSLTEELAESFLARYDAL